ncbi:polysaccharide lyase family 1 protein [Flagelloscypha sp. PMI_526]|nr:polysaccharide lyase family 1 protein [Flagelloscypha sp. PMI_526]
MYFLLTCLFLAHTTLGALVGYATQNGGTTGGSGGTTTTVTAAAAFTSAVKETLQGDAKKTVYLKGAISLSSQASVGSNTSIIGVGNNATINGGGLKISKVSNVIVQNLIIDKVVGNDGITVTTSTNVWVDHNEFYSDLTHGVDYYDGQLDINHAADFVTISNNIFRDHYKSSLVGGSADNGAEGAGHFRLTYVGNHWSNVHTRTPALRFSHTHIYNNLYSNVISQGIHSRCDAQVFVEGNKFENSPEPLSTYGLVIPDDSPNTSPAGDLEADGYANLGAANDWGTGKINLTHTGTFTQAQIPYTYTILPVAQVSASVIANAGVGKI